MNQECDMMFANEPIFPPMACIPDSAQEANQDTDYPLDQVRGQAPRRDLLVVAYPGMVFPTSTELLPYKPSDGS